MNESSHTAPPVILAEGLSKHFMQGNVRVDVLRDVNLRVEPGEKVAILGVSGAGKSTLLHLLGGLDLASSGKVAIDGQDLSKLSDKKRGRLRNQKLGFVYQFHHLMPEFSALENVAMPAAIGSASVSEARQRATELLSKVGLAQRLAHKPGALSGGERQRAAIARALVTRPACLLADEPTGNLDRQNALRAYDLMVELNTEFNTAVIVVTHDPQLAERMDRIVRLVDGTLEAA